MRTVVTGAGGFIGSRLAARLLDEGHEVVGIDRLSDSYDPERKRAALRALEERPGFRALTGDLNELDLREVLAGADTVFHLAAQPGVRASWGSEFGIYLADNVHATQRLLEALSALGGGRLVFASSSSVYGDAKSYPTAETATPSPISPYGVTKLAAEHLCRMYARAGVETVILRYFTIFGPGQRPDMAFARFIDAALEGRELEILGDGRQVRDFTYVDDAVAATIAAGEHGRPGEVYNVAGGTQASVLDVIEVLEELLNTPVKRRHLPAAAGDVQRTSADSSKARSELGFAPRVGLAEGLREQLAAHRAAIG
ncbi:MAG TPA: NAD-dependent epimerase/dehydratase family protein [Solirubrobacterales bacterium]|jgi:nucleoside-diphosphate-sugar epimerase